jgi:hypothetical protein
MTFETPRPLSATVGLILGELRLTASERDTTVVEVRPSDATNKEDVQAAEKTRVECAAGRLTVMAPRARSWSPRSSGGSIEVTIELPAGSSLQAGGQLADFVCAGPLGDCRIKTGLGQISVGEADTLNLKCGAGDIDVERASGSAELATGSGDIRVGAFASSAVIKNSNGDTWIGVAGGELRLNAANGSLAIDRAERSVVAKAANGDVRLGEVVRGTVVLETAVGDVEVGIPEGTAAYLDVNATAGRVENLLTPSGAPEGASEGVEVRARTSLGNVVIRRPR